MSVTEQLLLVGSIPLDTAEDVFTSFGKRLGPYLTSMPDGEGPRKHWISRVHYQVFVGHPDLEILRRPNPDNGIERLNPHGAGDGWQFKVRDGVDRVRFGDPGWRLGFARDALNSYFVFRTLREKGVLPAKLLPGFHARLSAIRRGSSDPAIPHPAILTRWSPSWHDRVKIPEGSGIQWDCTTEMQDA
jgi:hypothetical protein